MKPQKLLVATTSFVLIGLFILLACYGSKPAKTAPLIAIDGDGAAFLGDPSSKNQVFVFEDPLCPKCGSYGREILLYLQKGEKNIKYTSFAIALTESSYPAAEALTAVLYQNAQTLDPSLYFSYLLAIYTEQKKEPAPLTKERLLTIAMQASPAIDIEALKRALDASSYRAKIEKDTLYAQILAGKNLVPPLIFFNGSVFRGSPGELLRQLQKKG